MSLFQTYVILAPAGAKGRVELRPLTSCATLEGLRVSRMTRNPSKVAQGPKLHTPLRSRRGQDDILKQIHTDDMYILVYLYISNLHNWSLME